MLYKNLYLLIKVFLIYKFLKYCFNFSFINILSSQLNINNFIYIFYFFDNNINNLILHTSIQQNTNLLNIMSFYHPIILYIYLFSITLNRFYISLNIFTFKKLNNFIWLLISFIFSCIWSSNEILWGGYWNWDIVEISLLLLICIHLYLLHFINFSYVIYISYTVLYFFFIISFFIINKTNFIISQHSFSNTFINSINFNIIILLFFNIFIIYRVFFIQKFFFFKFFFFILLFLIFSFNFGVVYIKIIILFIFLNFLFEKFFLKNIFINIFLFKIYFLNYIFLYKFKNIKFLKHLIFFTLLFFLISFYLCYFYKFTSVVNLLINNVYLNYLLYIININNYSIFNNINLYKFYIIFIKDFIIFYNSNSSYLYNFGYYIIIYIYIIFLWN